MVYAFTDFDSASYLYSSTVASAQPIGLTNANPWVEKELLLASMEVIRWPSKTASRSEAFFILPPDTKAAPGSPSW